LSGKKLSKRWNKREEKPKVILINPPVNYWKLFKWYRFFTSREFPLGLLYVASYISENQFDVKIIDSEREGIKKTLEQLRSVKPDIVGITTTTFAFDSTSTLAKKIRKILPDTLIIIGGSHPSALPTESLKLAAEIDGCIIGNGEEVMLKICRQYPPEKIPGLVWRKSNNQIVTNPAVDEDNNSLDKYPLKWDLIKNFPESYHPSIQSRKRKSTSLVVSRGCYYNCSFCATDTIHGRKIKHHSVDYTVALIESLKKKYSIKDIYFHDDYFAGDIKWLQSFCNLMIEKRLNITWSCASRIEPLLKKNILQLMYDAGCRQIGVGIESGTNKILKSLNKKVSVKRLREGINLISKNNIEIKGYVIIGNKDDDWRTLFHTIYFILILPLSHIQVLYFTPLPGSASYAESSKDPKEWVRMNLLNPCTEARMPVIFLRGVELFIYFSFYTKKIFKHSLKLFKYPKEQYFKKRHPVFP
jgi:anaerobic magnesium-protoporphyrin IX monomethyl ester cyclase